MGPTRPKTALETLSEPTFPKIAGVEHNEVTGVTLSFHPGLFCQCCLRGTYGSCFTDMVSRLGYPEKKRLDSASHQRRFVKTDHGLFYLDAVAMTVLHSA
jgi:hypothetical protein